MDADSCLLELAERQHGFALRWDARSLGLSAKALRIRIGRDEWESDGPRVLRRPGAPISKATPLMRAALDAGPGAFVSHDTAAAWWGLPGFDLLKIHVTRPRGVNGNRPIHAHHVHEVLDLAPSHVTVLDGIPIVRPERLAFELFATRHPQRAARATETAWSKRLLSGSSLHRVFLELFAQGRAGTVAAREFLESHPVDWVPYGSNLESRFHALMRDARIGPWRRQVDLGAEIWVGRVDFLAADRPLIVEVQRERYHAALLDVAADAKRRATFDAAGFVIVEVWDVDVWHNPRAVIEAVRRGWFDAARSCP